MVVKSDFSDTLSSGSDTELDAAAESCSEEGEIEEDMTIDEDKVGAHTSEATRHADVMELYSGALTIREDLMRFHEKYPGGALNTHIEHIS